jgi:hypothetical protein
VTAKPAPGRGWQYRKGRTDLSAVLVAALVERDFERLAGMLAPDVRMRALIPSGPVELSGAEPAAARFASWFGDSDGLELVRSGSDEVGDRLHVFYRLRVKRPGDSWKIIEQHLFCALNEGRIAALDLVCSGFRPDAGRGRRHRRVRRLVSVSSQSSPGAIEEVRPCPSHEC